LRSGLNRGIKSAIELALLQTWYEILPPLVALDLNLWQEIHIDFLLFPSQTALKALLQLRIESFFQWELIPQNALSSDAQKLFNPFKDTRDFHGVIIDDDLLSYTTEILVKSLSRSTIERLSTITWHFNSSGSSSEGLHNFLRCPSKNIHWESIYQSYQTMTKQRITFREFKASHDFLLYSPLGG
ncbi:hypothetical protein N7481_008433, partial [Penicillium waksmanii]|uniref:uncharacterized protein n=1 Tax=Penicillium waksmanii TaxID=69791 RepID=UPI0025471275